MSEVIQVIVVSEASGRQDDVSGCFTKCSDIFTTGFQAVGWRRSREHGRCACAMGVLTTDECRTDSEGWRSICAKSGVDS